MSCSNCGGSVPPILPYGIANGIVPFLNFTNYSPVIPKFYYDVYSLEEREKHICKSIAKLEAYSNYLADNVGKLAEEIGDTDKTAFNRVIMVEDYGAVGDGKTDCTLAIQTAIYENPYSRITFKGGVYLISDTVHLYQTQGATHLDFGGATVKWGGCADTWREGDTIYYQDTKHPYTPTNPSVMFAADTQLPDNAAKWGNTGGRSIIENGCIDGQNKASILLMSMGYNANITKIRFTGAAYCALILGSLDGSGAKSLQNIVSDITINDYTDGSLWSEYYRYGMMITYPDNQITNSNIAFYKYQICCRRGGNIFSNIHTTVQYAQEPQDGYYGSNVLIWPFSNGTHEFCYFDNCYFNAGKSVFLARDAQGNDDIHGDSRAAINMQVNCSSSNYTLYRTGNIPEGTELYIANGAKMTIILDNFGVLLTSAVAAAGIRLVDVYPQGKLTDTQMQLSRINIKSLTFNNDEFDIINAHNHVNPGESRWIMDGSTNLNGTYELGKIVYQSAGGRGIPSEPLGFQVRKYSGGVYSGYVYGSPSSPTFTRWSLENTNTDVRQDGQLYLEKAHLETIGGVEYWVSTLIFDTNGENLEARRELLWNPPNGDIYARFYMNSTAGNYKKIDSSRVAGALALSNRGNTNPEPTTLLVGDSYLVGTMANPDSPGPSWGDEYASQYSGVTQIFAKGGAGFWQASPTDSSARGEGVAGHNYRLLGVANCSIPVIGGNFNNVEKIIVAAGYNDGATENPQPQYVRDFIREMRIAYPFAQIYVAYLYAGDANHYTERRAAVANLYREAATAEGANFTEWANVQVLGEGTYDGLHPTAEVGATIGRYLYEWAN